MQRWAAMTCRGCEFKVKRRPFSDGSGYVHQPYVYQSGDDYACTSCATEIEAEFAKAVAAEKEKRRKLQVAVDERVSCGRGWSAWAI
jgi:hypothetical protein